MATETMKLRIALAAVLLGCCALGYGVVQRDFIAAFPHLKPSDDGTEAPALYPVPVRDRKFDRMVTIASSSLPDTLLQDDRLAAEHASVVTTLPPTEPIESPPLPRPRPRTLQKAYTLLSDIQIDAIRGRLKLTAEQQGAWPAVEVSLRALANRLHHLKLAGGRWTDLSPDSPEIVSLKSAATPFIAQLRPDQKQELKVLAHLVGLGKVAAQL